MDKRAYGLQDLLGDALASAGAGVRGYTNSLHDDARLVAGEHSKATSEVRKLTQARADTDAAIRRNAEAQAKEYQTGDPMDALAGRAAGILDAHGGVVYPPPTTYNTHPAERAALAYSKIGPEAAALNAQLNTAKPFVTAGSLLSGAVPVGGHSVATPLMTALTSLLAEGLVKRYAPNASHMARGVSAGAGALGGRLLLRGYDHLKGQSDPTHLLNEVKTSAEKIAVGQRPRPAGRVSVSAQPQGAFATPADRTKSPRVGNVSPIHDTQASIGHKPNPSGQASASFGISAAPSLQFNSGNIRAGWIQHASGDLRRSLGLPTVAEQREFKRRDLEQQTPKPLTPPPTVAKPPAAPPVAQGGGMPRAGALAAGTPSRGQRPSMSVLDQANTARLLARHSPFRGAVGGGAFTNESTAQRFLTRNPRFAAAALKMRGMGSA